MNINKLLDFLIDYYRKKENNNHNVLNILEPPITDTQSNSNYSNSSENSSVQQSRRDTQIPDVSQNQADEYVSGIELLESELVLPRVEPAVDPFDIENTDDICAGRLTRDNYIEKINRYLTEIGITSNIQTLYSILTSKHPVKWNHILPTITKDGRIYKMNLKGKEIRLGNYVEISRGSFKTATK